jgi:hypothetical protein
MRHLAPTASGHEEPFAQTRMSAGCGFRKETIVGIRRNGRDAPKAAIGASQARAPAASEATSVRRGDRRFSANGQEH